MALRDLIRRGDGGWAGVGEEPFVLLGLGDWRWVGEVVDRGRRVGGRGGGGGGGGWTGAGGVPWSLVVVVREGWE